MLAPPRPARSRRVALVAALALGTAMVLAGCILPPTTPTSTTTTSSTTSTTAAPPVRWVPPPGTTFQIQFSGLPIDTTVDAQVYDLDGFDTDVATVAALHAQGRKVVCYISAGSWEDWRPDAAAYPAAVKGKALDGWPGEKWVDVRRLDVLGPILGARMDLCKSKGFDAVDPDNVDGYTNKTGFPLKADDQLAFNRLLASLAHDRGLSIGLKNDLDQIPQLVDSFEFAVNEQCAQFNECPLLSPFVAQGKAVFELEYSKAKTAFCPKAATLGLTGMRKHRSLDAYRDPC